jgi:DUF2075 family protein/predicted GIY-YIG superfamily endonuclease
MSYSLQIQHQEFNIQLSDKLKLNRFISDLWPLVYILSDDLNREAYIGETTDAVSRMLAHLKNDKKKHFSVVHLVTSEVFNKSATLDIESNLIRYFSGDGLFTLINGNLGIANHTYYQKNEIYWNLFKDLWKRLQKEGLAKNSLEFIDNSDLFKYSPFKALTGEQMESIILVMKSLLDKGKNTIVIEGGAGTGKTILATYLFKLLNSDLDVFTFREFGDKTLEILELAENLKNKYPNPQMGLVIPMSSFRQTIKKVFSNVKGLNAKMVIGPAEVTDKSYDILIVDESHRLRKRVNLGAYFGAFDKANEKLKLNKYKGNELNWVLNQSLKQIFFYDVNQSIKPSDVDAKDFIDLKSKKSTIVHQIKSQFRVTAGTNYVELVNKLLSHNTHFISKQYQFKNYEFLLFDNLGQMIKLINQRNSEYGLSRLVAGYSWKWISKNGAQYDIEIQGMQLKWNSVNTDWVNSSNAINEVGCIHTTQGYDLNYTGIIFGNEISFDKKTNTIKIIEENYYDKNGKNSIQDPNQLKEYILNIYKTLMLRGIRGTFIYACDPYLLDYFKMYIPLFNAYQFNETISIAAE